MGRTKKIKKEDEWDDGGYSKPSPDDYAKNDKIITPNLSDALLELDPTNKPAESSSEPASEMPADVKIDLAESEPQKNPKEILTARVELIKSIATAHDKLKEIDDKKVLITETQKSKIEKVFRELEKISTGLKEAEGMPIKEMEERIEQYNKRIAKFNNKISSLKKEIKEMADKLIEEGKEGLHGEETKKSQEKIEVPKMPEQEIMKIVDYLEEMARDGHAMSDYQKWSDVLRTRLPADKNESEQMKAKRKLVDEQMFNENLKKVYEHLKLIHDQKQAESMIGLKTGEEREKWAKRKEMLDEIFGRGEPAKTMTEIPVPDEEYAIENPATEETPVKETPIEIPDETVSTLPETISPVPETLENPPADIFDMENAGEIREQYERIQQLSVRLGEARNKLKEAFVKKEKASGIVGKFKKMFGSKDSELANQEYEAVWNEYANLQKEMIEASQIQAGYLREFLKQESNDLQAKIGEYYKGKENIISKVWRRLGEMNLANYLEKKAVAVKSMEEQGEEIGKWDRFWANRAKELEQSNKLYKIGAKVLSVRLGLSMGLLGGGIFGIPGVAEARGAFVGLGSAMGSRHLEDAAQNKIQRWLGNRGEFYSSSEEAQKIMKDRFGIVEKTMDEGADPNEPEDKKTARRRKKYEKMLGKAEKDMLEFEALPVADRLEKIQEKISAIEAYAYVNGLDLSKDASYQQLLLAREKNTEKYLMEKAVEIGDERPVVRPDSLEDAMVFLESRKTELSKTAEKVAAEKQLRWAKRLVSVAVGAVSGTYAYLATLSRAELFNGGGSSPEATPVAGVSATEIGSDVSAPNIGEAGTAENITMEDYVVKMNAEDLAAVKNFVATAGDNEKVLEAFNKAINEGHSPKEIYESLMVHKGDGMERILQRQLTLNPEKFGYQGDLEDASAVRKWAGHEASAIAQKQGIADEYFIYNENKPQFLILNEDKSVDSLGRLHHVSEILKTRAVEAARLTQESAEQVTPSEGGVTEVREVIDGMTGEPKILTNAEQAEFDKLFENGQFDEAMDYMLEHRARGPIFETSDGLQVHRADIGEWEGEAPKIRGDRMIHETLYEDGITTDTGGGYIREEGPPAEIEIAQSNPEVEVGAEIFETEPINSFDSRFGTVEFKYNEQGQPDSFILPDNADYQSSLDRILVPPKDTLELSRSTEGLAGAVDVYDRIYVDMQNQGLQNTAEAGLIKDKIKRFSELVSKDLNKKPEELFNTDIVDRYNLKK